jgi:tRNA(fMet)-specific endonuclease VapC
MILVDTDHLSVLTEPREVRRGRLLDRIDAADDIVLLPVVSVEEQLRGWLAQVRRERDVHRQIVPYLRLVKLFEFLRGWQILPWTEPAADTFSRLRSLRVRIGTQDLKIASIALVNDALLLSANLRDFEQVPGLRVEDWLAD